MTSFLHLHLASCIALCAASLAFGMEWEGVWAVFSGYTHVDGRFWFGHIGAWLWIGLALALAMGWDWMGWDGI